MASDFTAATEGTVFTAHTQRSQTGAEDVLYRLTAEARSSQRAAEDFLGL
jgi:hypothetical protein